MNARRLLTNFLVLVALAVATGSLSTAALAQSSPSYKIPTYTFNAGGDPQQGASPASATYKIPLDALGDAVSGGLLTSPSFREEGGFVPTVLAGICPTITLSPPSLPGGTAGTPYNQTFGASPPGTAYTFAVTAGSLPPGLSLSAMGTLSGTPAATGSYAFTVTATGWGLCTGSSAYTLAVACPATITLSPASLPATTAGTPYSQALTASPAGTTYTYSATGGSLPPGLSLSSGGVLSGTPAANGSYSFTVTASGWGSCAGSRPYTVAVSCPAVSLAPPSLSDGAIGVAYAQTITAAPAGTTYTFSVTGGGLPPGLALSSAGVLSGTPTALGSYTFTVTATGWGTCAGSRSYALNVGCPTIGLSPASLPAGATGVPYAQTIAAAPPGGAYTYFVTAGNLPPGLSLSASGSLAGTPTATGGFSFTVTATGWGSCSGSQGYTVTIGCPAVTLSPASLPGAPVGSPYSQTLTASPPGTSYSFAVTAGSLPPGLTLSAGGLLSGTATAMGSYPFTVTASGWGSCAGSQAYTLSVGCPTIELSPPTLPDGAAGTPYGQTLTAGPSGTAYSFSITAGSLPPGLSLSSGGSITGTPTAMGDYSFTATAAGWGGTCSGSLAYTLHVGCPTIAFAPESLPAGTASTPYSQVLTAGPPGTTYTFSATGGSLPPGLGLSASGLLDGTPTAAGTYTFTATATGWGTCSGSRVYTLAINCAGGALAPAPPLAPGTAGSPYAVTFTASPAGPAYTYTLSSGLLPPGLSLSTAGALAGTPTLSGNWSFTVMAAGGSCIVSESYALRVDCPAVSLSPASLPPGTAGSDYLQALAASPSGTAYTFSVTAGSLPPGVALSASGSLAGAPAEAGAFAFTVTASGWGDCFATRDYVLAVNCPTVTLAPSSLPPGNVGTPYSQALTASPAGPYTFAVTSGSLPPGFSLSPSGTLGGIASATGTWAFTVSATGWGACSGSRTYNLSLTCSPIYLSPLPTNLPNAVLGGSYDTILGAAGGTAPYTFAVIQDALPPGLALDPSGRIFGTPSAVGNYRFTVQATDQYGCTGSKPYEIYVCPPITVGPASLPSGKVGTSYSKTLTAAGGTAPYTFAVSSGLLPPGLSLAPTGVLSGVPTTSGAYSFTVSATDARGCSGSSPAYTVIVCGTVTLYPPSPLPNGQVGIPYSQLLTVSGGGGACSFAVTAGALPPGIGWGSTPGLLEGGPLYGGAYSFTVTATCGGVCTGSRAYTLYVCPTITLSPATLPSGKVRTLYSKIIAASGGTAPYTFTVATGSSLPPGLTLNSVTGKLSGYPTAAGTFAFTLKATDAKGCSGSRTYTVTISP